MNRIIRIACAGIVLAILASTASVHGQSKGSTVQGTITDEASWVIPGVTVTATNRDTQASSSAITDANGKYTFSALPDGDYVISAFLKGFSATEVHKPIAKDSSVQQDFVLKIAPQGPDDPGFVIHPDGNFR